MYASCIIGNRRLGCYPGLKQKESFVFCCLTPDVLMEQMIEPNGLFEQTIH
jgi:hypothetical protein